MKKLLTLIAALALALLTTKEANAWYYVTYPTTYYTEPVVTTPVYYTYPVTTTYYYNTYYTCPRYYYTPCYYRCWWVNYRINNSYNVCYRNVTEGSNPSSRQNELDVAELV